MKAKHIPRIDIHDRMELKNALPLRTPYVIYIDPCDTCNFRCKFCPSGNLERMQKDLPIWFFAGQQDPVGAMGNGVLKAVRVFKEIGMTGVGVELYPNMRHECHNEIGREKVYQDILNWIQQKCL